ncbi:DUF2029 domain-containing protein [Bradyrhizobium tropiciagri]|uniref:glycosyltransferase family 87 protein n=1 Tax=Bradyrhizobium tropiciagri TaxID=312253 RepID=UPI001BA602D7|nr:glycosyltransferase family 87 protein [Bradyrhizobium tropiciagri]MBR0875462.1 DUF2029 domain-containing protein [Bradyrhizobium tropiciagri]
MAVSRPPPRIGWNQIEIPARLRKVCFALCAINVTVCVMAFLLRAWIYDANGLGIPTDFVSFWAGGHLALEGVPAQAFEWDVLKRVEVAKLGQDFEGDFPWHYPPPFFFVACALALLPYSVAYLGWILASLVPYLAVMRAIVGHNFGILLALAAPFVFINALVGQNGFLTAALIGGTLYLIPIRPVLAGICLGLLAYKPQYGLLFPIVLGAAGHWRVFVSAAITTIAVVAVSWLAFGTESWLAFFRWMPISSQAIMSEGKATWWKLQSLYSMVRYFGGTEQLAWALQFVLAAFVAVGLALMWRSRLRYSLKAAALAAGTLLATPYVAIYDMVVLAVAVGFLVRIGLKDGFLGYELPALACALVLVAGYFAGKPTGLGVTLIVSTLILARAASWWRREPAPIQMSSQPQ